MVHGSSFRGWMVQKLRALKVYISGCTHLYGSRRGLQKDLISFLWVFHSVVWVWNFQGGSVRSPNRNLMIYD